MRTGGCLIPLFPTPHPIVWGKAWDRPKNTCSLVINMYFRYLYVYLYSMILYYVIVLYYMIIYVIMFYCNSFYCIILYLMLLCFIVLYYVMLFYFHVTFIYTYMTNLFVFCIYIYIHVCIYIYICVCMCVYSTLQHISHQFPPFGFTNPGFLVDNCYCPYGPMVPAWSRRLQELDGHSVEAESNFEILRAQRAQARKGFKQFKDGDLLLQLAEFLNGI